MTIKKFKNRKAEFIISSDTVKKSYFNKNQNIEEYNLLKGMNDKYSDTTFNGWKYSLVKVLEGDENGFLMEKIKGRPLIEDGINEDSYYHAGVWLGHFHSLSRRENTVEVFGDYNLSNIYIDKKGKIITAADPDIKGLSVKNYYWDIMIFFKLAYLNRLRKVHIYNKSCVDSFIKGYNVYGLFEYNQALYNENIKEVLNNFIHPDVVKRKGVVRSYTGYFLLGGYLKFILNKTLRSY